jgi:hypothetical protein
MPWPPADQIYRLLLDPFSLFDECAATLRSFKTYILPLVIRISYETWRKSSEHTGGKSPDHTSSDSSTDAETDQQHHHSIDTVSNNNNGTPARTSPPPATAAASSANGGAPAAAAGRQPRKQGLFKRIENNFTAA